MPFPPSAHAPFSPPVIGRAEGANRGRRCWEDGAVRRGRGDGGRAGPLVGAGRWQQAFSAPASCSPSLPAPVSISPHILSGAAFQPSLLEAHRHHPFLHQPSALLEPSADPHKGTWERISAQQPQAQTDPRLDQTHQHTSWHRGDPPAHAEGQEVSDPLKVWCGVSWNRALELPWVWSTPSWVLVLREGL